MTTALVAYDRHLETLCDAQLLCLICQERPWTQRGRWHQALLCGDCAAAEPDPEEETP